jgi:hypothetical protein
MFKQSVYGTDEIDYSEFLNQGKDHRIFFCGVFFSLGLENSRAKGNDSMRSTFIISPSFHLEHIFCYESLRTIHFD